MTARHAWKATESQGADGASIQRCAHCDTERMPDSHAKSLFLYRGGRALPPNGKPLTDAWHAYRAGVIPKCTGKVSP